MPEPLDFDRARRHRLIGGTNENTTPQEALAVAADYLAEHSCSGKTVVVIEAENGGVVLVTAGTTHADSVYLLEAAKLFTMGITT